MSILRIALRIFGGVALCACLAYAYIAFQISASTETWLVRFPEEVVADPIAVAAVRGSLLARAASLHAMGVPTVRYQGNGEFEIELSAPGRASSVISSALTDPGDFWIRVIGPGDKPSCDDSVPAIVGPGSIERADIGFNQEQEPMVNVRLSVPAGELFRDHSGHNAGRSVALCLGEKLLLAPTIRAEVGRYLQIDGLASADEAARLAAILNGGSIPEGASITQRDAV